MLFNSYTFIAAFLPAAVLAVWLTDRFYNRTAVLAVLTLASLFFYAWWNPPYVALLVLSIIGNYVLARAIAYSLHGRRKNRAAFVTAVGIGADLGVIAYYKYANFFIDNLDALTGLDFAIGAIILPLGISFFTFQQIAYLVDSYRGRVQPHGFVDYALFVSFFPQLIAGPIVYHGEMLGQLRANTAFRFTEGDIGVGLKIFMIGLFKKVVLADGMAAYATPGFEAVEAGIALSLLEAWGAALAYTLQLYFDFSGYSDMAIGLGRLFGLHLPINFNSPYKAHSVIDFWRRWHITLSRFLRMYLYIPLGGNRRGDCRRWTNLLVTMLLGGLWHGAGWTFVVWGGLHGLYLCLNHFWRFVRQSLLAMVPSTKAEQLISWALTFVAVVVAWVFFRAESFAGAIVMLEGMAGLHGVVLTEDWSDRLAPMLPLFSSLGIELGPTPYFAGTWQVLSTAGLLLAVFVAPNTQQWVEWQFHAGSGRSHGLRGTVTALLFGLVGCYTALHLFMGGYSEFLYFQF